MGSVKRLAAGSFEVKVDYQRSYSDGFSTRKTSQSKAAVVVKQPDGSFVIDALR